MPMSFIAYERTRGLEDAGPQGTGDELHGQVPGRVRMVEDRVHLDHLEGREEAGLGDELHRQVRFPVGEAPAHRSSHTRGYLRIAYVDIEGEVHERGALCVREG